MRAARELSVGQFSILIPDADDGFSIPVAYCLKMGGQIVHGLSRRQSRMMPLSRLFQSFDFPMREFEISSWLSQIDEIVTRRNVDVILPVSSMAIRTLSENRSQLSCADKLAHLPSPQSFDTATNKAALANFLAACGLPQPSSVVLGGDKPAADKLSRLKFPVLLKPPLARGGSGIRRFESLNELQAFLAGADDEQQWVVQEFVAGSDLCVNVLCQEGRIIASTVQHAITPSSVEYAPCSGFEFDVDDLATGVARQVVEKLRWSGIANFDMRLDRERKAALVLEINGRYWLSMRGSLHAGVNFPLLACEAALGLPKSNQQPRKVRYFIGQMNALLSLVGGGRLRIRPAETDLGYFAYDPMRVVSAPIVKLAGKIQRKISSLRGESQGLGGLGSNQSVIGTEF
jgi:hypothetical protein